MLTRLKLFLFRHHMWPGVAITAGFIGGGGSIPRSTYVPEILHCGRKQGWESSIRFFLSGRFSHSRWNGYQQCFYDWAVGINYRTRMVRGEWSPRISFFDRESEAAFQTMIRTCQRAIVGRDHAHLQETRDWLRDNDIPHVEYGWGSIGLMRESDLVQFRLSFDTEERGQFYDVR